MEHKELNSLLLFLKSQDLSVSEKQKQQLSDYLHFLAEWNSRMNLVSSGDVSSLIQRHISHSFFFIHILKREKLTDNALIMDLGSGAGFPGIPISIYFPDKRVILLDSSRKKKLFLRHVRDNLGISAEIVCERAEHLADAWCSQIGVITARAVASMDRLGDLSLPLLNKHGFLLTVKGAGFRNEMTHELENRFKISVLKPGSNWLQQIPTLSDKLFIKMEKKNGGAKII